MKERQSTFALSIISCRGEKNRYCRIRQQILPSPASLVLIFPVHFLELRTGEV